MNWEYIGGFFDGEGCVGIKKQPNRRIRVDINISQKKGAILYEIAKFLSEFKIESHIYNNKDNVPYLQIAQSRSARLFLENIQSHVFVKREDVDRGLAIPFDKKWTDITAEEKTEILRLHANGVSYRKIATMVGRDESSVYRVTKRRC
jgi:intein-encoded DNA endonuclease-like protein